MLYGIAAALPVLREQGFGQFVIDVRLSPVGASRASRSVSAPTVLRSVAGVDVAAWRQVDGGSGMLPAGGGEGGQQVDIGDDTLWGVNRPKKGAGNTLAALRSIRAARPDGAPIYVILDNLSAHKGDKIRRWAKKNRVELWLLASAARRAALGRTTNESRVTSTRAPATLAP